MSYGQKFKIYMKGIWQSTKKEMNRGKTAANERFHASGGVFPQTVLWEFGSLSPARTFVEPPPA